jgi:hypothetical protein
VEKIARLFSCFPKFTGNTLLNVGLNKCDMGNVEPTETQKFMKTVFLALTSCIALASLTLANPQDNNKKKGQKQGGQQAQHQQVHTGKGRTGINAQMQGQHHGVSPALQSNKVTTRNRTNTFNKTVNKTTINNTNVNRTTVNKTVFRGRHFDLSNNPNPKIAAVKYNANYHIPGSQNWHGERYVVFRDYHPVWHDRGWWVANYPHTVFVFGGWYYWNAGYYYPAWGYAPNAYYAYDGPIYVGSYETDPGQVVANVQEKLQEQGLYQGEVDGILGPQTRGALADYQQAQGLEPTGAVDEPTLESLGLA